MGLLQGSLAVLAFKQRCTEKSKLWSERDVTEDSVVVVCHWLFCLLRVREGVHANSATRFRLLVRSLVAIDSEFTVTIIARFQRTSKGAEYYTEVTHLSGPHQLYPRSTTARLALWHTR
jgi:hypothetical protein